MPTRGCQWLQFMCVATIVMTCMTYAPGVAQVQSPKSDANAATVTAESGQSAKNEFSVNDIYEATRAGRFEQAKNMIKEVLQDHPQSSKAHFVAAEVYAKSGDLRTAKRELDRAEELRPGLPFANAKSVAKLRRKLSDVKPATRGDSDPK